MKSRSDEVKRLHVSAKQTLATSVIATGFPYDKDVNPTTTATTSRASSPTCGNAAAAGSAAYDLSCVAAGLLTAIGSWICTSGTCAANLIVREAGAPLDFRPDRGVSQAAGNETLVREILKYVI